MCYVQCVCITILGTWFASCGSVNLAMKNIHDKALKSFYKLKQFDTRDSPRLTMKLFDTLVLPIASYACEVWCPFTTKNISKSDFMSVCDNIVMEKLNIKLCKYLLGVNRYSTNAAVKGELGRPPLMTKFLIHSIKYWFRLHNLNVEKSFAKQSYLDNLICSTRTNNSWSSAMYNILNKFNLENTWDNQGETETSINIINIKADILNQYSSAWLNHITRENVPNKLLNYSSFKTKFAMENYVLCLPVNKRKNFTKLRISSHPLEIEKGRYSRPKVPAENRLCKFCNSSIVETEKHFLLECTLYDKIRINLYDTLKVCSLIDTDNHDETYLSLMGYLQGDTEIAEIVCHFIDACFSLRQEVYDLISSQNDKFIPFALEFIRLASIHENL